MLTAQDLAGRWNLRAEAPHTAEAAPLAGVDVPAVVPGCVHVDLMRDGRLPNPFLDDNEAKVAWVGRTDWTYSRDIAWLGPECERVDLVFDGLDTVAEVSVAGVEVGSTRNMHRAYRFDIGSLLTSARTPLRVGFTSAYTEAEAVRAALGPRPNAYPEPFNFIRKMACAFGWDWGPTLVTAGIWRQVRLEGWSTARLASVRPLATYEDGRGRLDLTVDVERAPSGRGRDLSARVLLDGAEIAVLDLPAGATTARATVDAGDVSAWWPRGHGDQPLYELAVVLTDAERPLDRWMRRTGFRTVHIDTSADAAGTKFVVHVNGKAILVKGVNWIPDDIFPVRVTRERYARRLGEAASAGVNLVRVWGGGIYESREFYETCDELGLMVWQDFLFACACYPEEEPIRSEVVAEARDNVARLAPHPSLVLWNGNNENLWLREPAGWPAQPGGDLSWGEAYYLDVLPAIVAELDPSRPYSAGSPWSGSWNFAPNSVDHQTFHSWDVWNREDYLRYRDSAPRFVAEFGWQAPPAWTTLRDAVSDEPLLPDSPGVLHHQKAEDGNGKLARGLAPHFPDPASTEAWHYLTQLNQVRAIRTGVEHWRSHWPHTAGTILWQLNDLWPVTSWAAIDGDGRYKPLFFALKELYAGRALTVQPRGDGLVVAVLNDEDSEWVGMLGIERQDAAGAVFGASAERVRVAPRSVALVPVSPAVAAFDDPSGQLLVATLGEARALWFAVPDRDFRLPDPALDVRVEAVDGGVDVHVRASRLARDLLVQPDRIHPSATVDKGFVTLLAGEATVFRVRGPASLAAERVAAPWVLADQFTAVRGALSVIEAPSKRF